ncbi:TonB-dependent siderophore myxochelin receptor MxcH [Vitiosangium sp. GDMCC 1.1324]|uniref:TonB-dependent siderophore myxochelin receptor MxcH n=1 Tax=Vitiosangium sp. (strain GDMCC 1.1324) TaxID=2138576 RepID=UPI001E4F2E12|nr:TonB-dependent siderophore myxochelin receptor MxcH [Vitiosangium sp. GDMCC 1.1324]
MAPARVLEPPKLLEFVEASYPDIGRSERLEAKVPLRLMIDARGNVTEAEVLEPAGHGFDEAAREAALRFRFESAKRNGQPMPSRIHYTYEFRLPPQEPPPPAPVEAAPAAVSPGPVAEEPIEVTVQGESAAERRRQSAEAVQVVETESIKREAADLGEAMARTESVGVRRAGGLGSRTRFSLGGLTDEQIRFFIDGVPLELAGFGSSLANVPVNLIQQVELYQGVVPIRFGIDALGGAVQLITDQDVRGTGAAASYELGSFDTHRFSARLRHLHAPSGFLIRANGFVDRTRNDYPMDVEVANERGKLEPARVYRFHDAYQAAGLGVEAGFVDRPWARRLLLRVFANTSDKELQNNTTATKPYGEVETGEVSVGSTLRYEQLFSQGLSAETIVGYTWRQSSFTDIGRCSYDWFGRCIFVLPQPGEVDSSAVDRHVEQHTGFGRFNLGWNAAPQHTLRLSLAPTYVTRVGEDLYLSAHQMLDPLTGARNLLSLVSGLEYQLNALGERLENIVFIKDYVQRAHAQKPLPDGGFWDLDQNSHRVGVGDSARLRISRQLYAKASYEWATRVPRPDELFGDGGIIVENLALKPETSHNINVGLTLESGSTRAGDFRANVNGFGRLADQLIVLLGQEAYLIYQNVFAARILGVAGAAGWTSPGQYLSLDGNITWQDFRNISDEGLFSQFEGQRIPNQPHLLANGSARFLLRDVLSSNDELSLTWHSRYVHTFFRAWAETGVTDSSVVIPSQFLHSVSLTYVIRRAPATLSWTVDVQNLTDARAYDFYGVQRPGRSIFAKLTAEL